MVPRDLKGTGAGGGGREKGPFALGLNLKKAVGHFQWHVYAKEQQDVTGTEIQMSTVSGAL